MRLSSTNMDARKMLFAAILSICALSSKKISIYNEEMIVALCFIGFIIFSRKSLGTTFKVTLDGRIQAIQEEIAAIPQLNEVVSPESNEQQRLLRISLRIVGTVVESLPMARCAPKCEKTVQALLCRNLNVKSATLTNATSSRRIRFQDDLVTKFYTLVGNQFAYSSISKAERVEFIRESLVVLRMVRGGGVSLKNKEEELNLIDVHALRRADPIPRLLLSQEVQQVLEEFWDIMPHELVAKCALVGQSTTRSSWSLEPNPQLFRLGLG
ncbi:LOW QUALITY PROTEIN: ATP synthase protein MI25-like [Lycium ferocissimum]|uniref:LOW QUALITY PROTEIN: ATP synthase protein MI25-like n=1 Tax=Lycium ferocissimum TaxID=112874 RepID=UPI0028163B97|nr:LOW QUALITY PROTEIN: ATP synthase protein MI25-like [Lycium ferocissimum]